MPGVEIKRVTPEDEGMRLNRWFLKYYPSLSLGRFQKLLRTKQIKVDGKKAESGLKLMMGQEIRIPPMDEQVLGERPSISKKDAELAVSLVIYKDRDILVFNKQSGLA